MTIRIAIVDDTRMFREALRRFIDLEPGMTVIGTASDGQDGLELIRQDPPDLVLMDIRMPVMDGVQATRALKAEWPRIHVIMLTTFSDDEFIFEAIKAGAAGYLLKDMDPEAVIEAIRVVQTGGVLIPPAIAARLVADYTRLSGGAPAPGTDMGLAIPPNPPPSGRAVPAPPSTPLPGQLTARETEVLGLLALGLSTREIAERLFLTEGTVKNYISTICAKLGVRDRVQAVSLALRHGLVQ